MERVFLVLALVLCGCQQDPNPPLSHATHDMHHADASDVFIDVDAAPRPDVIEDTAPDGSTSPCTVRWPTEDEETRQRLSEYCFFEGVPNALQPSEGVVPYQVVAPLYSDGTVKSRFIVLPPGQTIDFDPNERWTFPDGTILIKSFGYHEDPSDPTTSRIHLETRLMVLESEGWTPYVYVWNEEQTDATLWQTGKWLESKRLDESQTVVTGPYRVPNTNQCKGCHGQADVMQPLGPRARQLHHPIEVDGRRVDQLSWLAEAGLFSNDIGSTEDIQPLADPLGDADLERRARSYLETNCAHCHNPNGVGGPSGLNLSIAVEAPIDFGVCRRPVAAGTGAGGHAFDIKPGHPEESIIVFRMSSTDPELKMPELPTLTSDADGVRLISEWIENMDHPPCDE